MYRLKRAVNLVHNNNLIQKCIYKRNIRQNCCSRSAVDGDTTYRLMCFALVSVLLATHGCDCWYFTAIGSLAECVVSANDCRSLLDLTPWRIDSSTRSENFAEPV